MVSDTMTKEDENVADALLAAITTIGRPLEEPKKEVKKKGREKVLIRNQWRDRTDKQSRFFYKPTVSFDSELEHRKKIAEPKELELADAQVVERSAAYGKELPPKLDKNIKKVREFWLQNVAPLTLAAQAGSSQAKDVVQRTLNVPVDDTPFLKFQRMLEQGLTIKMANYLVSYLGIPRTKVNELIDAITPKKEVMVFGPNPREDRRIRSEPEPVVKE